MKFGKSLDYITKTMLLKVNDWVIYLKTAFCMCFGPIIPTQTQFKVTENRLFGKKAMLPHIHFNVALVVTLFVGLWTHKFTVTLLLY